MKVIVTAGGSGGHIYPALAIIQKIKEKEPLSEFLYIGTTDRMEKDIVPKYGIKYIGIEMYGLTKNIPRDVKAVYLTFKNINYCKKIMKEFKPDIVLGIGGYVTFPVIKAAKSLKIKTFIHEQNMLPGKSNRLLGRLADKIGVTFEGSIDHFDKSKTVYTGHPCSDRAIEMPIIPKYTYGLHKDKKFVLMVQGSLGSTTMNNKMLEFLHNIKDEDYEVLYITGKSSYDNFKKNTFSPNVFIVPYVDNLPGLMKEADIIISRAGAGAISEIIALKKLSILIPSPYVANNHQFFNALEVAKNRAAVMIEENTLTSNLLKSEINKILTDEEMQINMRLQLGKMAKNNACSIIYDIIKELTK